MDNNMGERICYCRRCNGLVYVVKRGDTIFNIAARYGITVNDILNENRFINVYNIQVGDRICIPVMPNRPNRPNRPPMPQRMNDNMDENNNMNDYSDGMTDINNSADNNMEDNMSSNQENMNDSHNDMYGRSIDGMEIDYTEDGAFELNEIDGWNSKIDNGADRTRIKDLLNDENLTVEEFVNYLKMFDK